MAFSRFTALVLVAFIAGCASFAGRGLVPGQSTAADVERVMGKPAERRQVGNESWHYYPRQPYGRATYVARVAPDGRLLGLEQRLTDPYISKIAPNATRGEQVREILGPPWLVTRFGEREVWTWHMRRFGDPGSPAQLNVQLSRDGVVREVYYLDESETERSDGVS